MKPSSLGDTQNNKFQTATKNPFHHDTINQRVAFADTVSLEKSLGDTGNFKNKISTVSGKAKQEEEKKDIYDIIMDKAYHIIERFQDEVGRGVLVATWD